MRSRTRLRLVPRLDDQTTFYDPDTGILVLAQRWSGFPGDRHAVVLVSWAAGRHPRRLEQMGTARQILDRYRNWICDQRIVGEDRAAAILGELGQVAYEACPECGERLPLGGRYCTACGRPHHVPRRGVLPVAFGGRP